MQADISEDTLNTTSAADFCPPGQSCETDMLDRYIDRVQHLPPAPTVAVQLLNLFGDPNRDVDRIVELVGLDPSLTAATLKRCNSAAHGGEEPVTDMFHAVCQLGFYEVYCIVSALIASRTMSQVRAKYMLDAMRLWRHTVTTGVVASILARRVQEVDATAFTAGLLHDIGKLIFISVEGIPYAEMVREKGFYGSKLALAEEESFGFTHAALGARLLTRWSLPANVCTAVRFHHQPPAAAGQFQHLAATVNFANFLAHKVIDGPAAEPGSHEAMDLLGLTPDDMPALLQRIDKSLESVQGLLRMHG
jgi:putative nucleotidyltransferase with HDIG domain